MVTDLLPAEDVKVDYLRLSITRECNLNCLYCRPGASHPSFPPPDFLLSTGDGCEASPVRERAQRGHGKVEGLSCREMVEIVKVLAANGIRKIRITGGEPLLREDVANLIKMLSNIREIEEISMTTNGVFLKNMAGRLKKAGLSRINISLDTLKRNRYKDITGEDYLNEVLQGIDEALRVRLVPAKLNVVVMKGINEDEILDFVEFAFRKKVIVRFIELFSTGNGKYNFRDWFLPNSAVREKIEMGYGPLEEIGGVSESGYGVKGSGPARYFRPRGYSGLIGFIDTTTSNFCNSCSRIRMSCDGKLYQCLFSSEHLDLRKEISQSTRKSIQKFFAEKKYHTKHTVKHQPFEMSMRGG